MTEQQEILLPENALPAVSAADLPDKMQAAVARAGWTDLTPVQSYAIPYALAGRDMMVQARTGSGKTGAFILPMLEKLDASRKECQALVLVPTRELANQVSAEAEMLTGPDGLNVVAVYGGTGYRPQIEAFKQGAHIVVGTPGRILDHLIKRNLNLDHLRTLVFDEADRMMAMGFYPDMVRLRDFLPQKNYLANMFSATFQDYVTRLGQEFLQKPGFLSLSRDHVHVTDTEHVLYTVRELDKDRILAKLIELENPTQALIFCNTKDKVHYITRVLQRFGYNADELSSDLSQSQREKVLGRLRDGTLRFLVATDVAARGLDIPELSHVFQVEVPEDHEIYIHRAGRTGRAGATGTAITLASLDDMRYIKRIEGVYEIEFERRDAPEDEEVESLVAQRLVRILDERLRERDRLQIERMERFRPLIQELMESEEGGLALLTMLLDDVYHQAQHQPPELPPIGGSGRDPEKKRGHKGEGHGSGGQRGGNRGGKRRGRGKRE